MRISICIETTQVQATPNLIKPGCGNMDLGLVLITEKLDIVELVSGTICTGTWTPNGLASSLCLHSHPCPHHALLVIWGVPDTLVTPRTLINKPLNDPRWPGTGSQNTDLIIMTISIMYKAMVSYDKRRLVSWPDSSVLLSCMTEGCLKM